MLEVNFGCKSVEDIKKEAYEQGVNDAFDAALKIEGTVSMGAYTVDELRTLFPNFKGEGCLLNRAMNEYSPLEIVKKVQEYEEKKKELHFGDVINHENSKGIITNITRDGTECYVLWRDGSCGIWKVSVVKKYKTGENMTIPEFLEKYGRIGE